MAFPTFRQVDYVYGSAAAKARVAALLRAAESRVVNIGIVGDSQEIYGSTYQQHLTRLMWARYGNLPMTCLYPPRSNSTMWLVKSYLDATTPADRLATSVKLPGYFSRPLVSGSTTRSIHLLEWTGINTGETTMRGGRYFHPDPDELRAEIFAATSSGAGELAWKATPTGTSTTTASHANLAFATATMSGTTSLELDSSTHAAKSEMTPALDYDGKVYMQIEIAGDSANAVDFLGVRFHNYSKRYGVALQPIAEGGYTAKRLMSLHFPQVGPMLRALGIDMLFVRLGVNNVLTSNEGDNTPETFKAFLFGNGVWNGTTGSLIETFREELNNPTLPIVFFVEQYTRASDGSALNSTLQEYFDEQAGALAEIADADNNVVVVNSRRAGDESGWNAQGYSNFTLDGVHYNSVGAERAASIDMDLLGRLTVADLTAADIKQAIIDLGYTSDRASAIDTIESQTAAAQQQANVQAALTAQGLTTARAAAIDTIESQTAAAQQQANATAALTAAGLDSTSVTNLKDAAAVAGAQATAAAAGVAAIAAGDTVVRARTHAGEAIARPDDVQVTVQPPEQRSVQVIQRQVKVIQGS